jgi:hypothetical protein
MHRPKLQYLIGGILLFIVVAVIPLALLEQSQPVEGWFRGRVTPRTGRGVDFHAPHKHKKKTPTPDSSTPTAVPTQQQDDTTATPTASGTPSVSLTPGISTVFTPPANSKSLYVSPSGDDDNDGTKDHPFATISHAAQKVSPGTVVYVLPGTYNEAITIKKSGSEDQRISFYSSTQWGAKIHTSNSDVPWTTRADYIDIVGFDISSSGSRDGIVNMGSFIRTIGNNIHDIPGKCDNIGGSGMTDGNYKAHDNDIIGNVVHNIGSSYPKMCQYVHAIYHSNARGHIYNNIAYDNAGVGINLWHAATDTIVANNLTFNNKEHGISIGTDTGNTGGKKGDNFIVANNIIVNNALLGVRERKGVLGHNQFVNNIVSGNGKAPFGDEDYEWPSAAGSKDSNTIAKSYQPSLEMIKNTLVFQPQATMTDITVDQGTKLGAPGSDYNGQDRPKGKGIDIGPFELQ